MPEIGVHHAILLGYCRPIDRVPPVKGVHLCTGLAISLVIYLEGLN